MSVSLLASTLQDLPYSLREQVIGYAESVSAAAPTIAASVDVTLSPQLSDQLVFLAGVRKLHGLVASSFWALDNATSLLALSEVRSVRVGALDYSRGSPLHTSLRELLDALELALAREGISEFLDMPYGEVLQRLVQRGPG